jgi:hypothetical protein
MVRVKTPTLNVYGEKPPHWRMDGSTYFITWRLAGAQLPLAHEERTVVADAIKHFGGGLGLRGDYPRGVGPMNKDMDGHLRRHTKEKNRGNEQCRGLPIK